MEYRNNPGKMKRGDWAWLLFAPSVLILAFVGVILPTWRDQCVSDTVARILFLIGIVVFSVVACAVHPLSWRIRIRGEAVEHVLFNRFIMKRYSLSQFLRVERVSMLPGGRAIATGHLVFEGDKRIRLVEMQVEVMSQLQRDLVALRYAPCGQASPVVVDPLWLLWNDGVIPNIVRSISEEQAFDRLPILADALEDAGCTDSALLEHLRAPGPHVRGCWAVNLFRDNR